MMYNAGIEIERSKVEIIRLKGSKSQFTKQNPLTLLHKDYNQINYMIEGIEHKQLTNPLLILSPYCCRHVDRYQTDRSIN